MIDYIKVPEGWTSEPYQRGCTVISKPGCGGVTIDWERRGYRNGWSVTGRLDSTARYTGRGWKERLIADAIERLQKVFAK